MNDPERSTTPGGEPEVEGCCCRNHSDCHGSTSAPKTQAGGTSPPLTGAPKISTAEAHFLRGYRDRWQAYFDLTGERRAMAVVECLTIALVEGGRLP